MYRIYEVDPDADTLLIVPHPTGPFAPWDEQPDATPPQLPPSSSPYAGILRGTSRPVNIYSRIASSPASAPTPVPETRIKVSSKHLSLASPRFRNKLLGLASEPDGRVHTHLPRYDPRAVMVAMDAVHGRGRRVPRAVDLETLAGIAAVVDAFGLLGAVQVYAERWFEALAVPGAYGRDLVLCIYAAYVFRRGDEFRHATRVAALGSDGPIRTLGLNIRDSVIREIDAQRQQLVRQSLDLVHGTIDALQEDRAPCPLGCDTLLLGALVKSLGRSRLVWPRPAKPFIGVSFLGVSQRVRDAQSQMAQVAPGLWLGSPRADSSRSKKRQAHALPLTPDSSPDSTRDSGIGVLDTHECEAQGDLAGRLDEVAGRVDGLQLESKLGFYLY